MLNVLTIITNIFSAGHSSSFLSAGYWWTLVCNFFSQVLNFILQLLWTVCKFVFGVMEAFEYMIHEFLGIGTTASDYIDYADNLAMGGGRNYLDTLVQVFKQVVGVSLVLMIIFTIFAIIKQEYSYANSGFEGQKGQGNSKGQFIMRLFKNIMMILLLPITMIFIISGVNSILTAFNNAVNLDTGVTVAGQVLATSTYDANKYRTYANANQRVPIIIQAYDNTDVKPDEYDDLQVEIKSITVQQSLKNTATNLVNGTFLSFKDSVTYKNNKFYNSTDYDGSYEKFVVTAEQYQVMADFIDYAQKHGMSYYVKSIDEHDIDWGYVNSVVYNSQDNALNITYRDANDIDGDGSDADTYTMTLAPENNVTSPISDALDSIMAMLGMGEYGDNVYNIMERDDSGDYVNLVQWANEKALIRFSEDFDLDNSATWTDTDQIIVYEFFHFAYNNTFAGYSIEDFEVERNTETGLLEGGVELEVSQITYKDYNEIADAYSKEKTIDCVLINGNYYYVEESDTYTDNYGNPYYLLKSQNDGLVGANVHFLDPSYFVLTKTANNTTLKLSSNNFDINKPNTWTVTDQILIYEYYKDLSINNDFSKYGFGEFYTGVEFPVYSIETVTANVNQDNVVVGDPTRETKYYVLINDTYYQLDNTSGSYSIYKGTSISNSSDNRFLVTPEEAGRTYYNYAVEITTLDGTTGFDTTLSTIDAFFVENSDTFTQLDKTETYYNFYSNFVLQMSENFDYTDITTWSYRDYFLFYLYTTYDISVSLESLKFAGLSGTVGKKGDVVCYEIPLSSGNIYLNIDLVSRISELNLTQRLDVVETLKNNDIDDIDNNLFVSYDDSEDKLLLTEINSVELNFSSEFDETNVSSWTVLDTILYYFSSTGHLDSVSKIKSVGYETFIYTTEDQNNLYRFGNIYDSTNPTGYTQPLFLSEYNVLHKMTDVDGNKVTYDSLEAWFNANMLDYICRINCLNSRDVVATYDELFNNLTLAYDNYVYDVDFLISSLIIDNWQEELSTFSQYTYTNPDFVYNDLSTWNQFDMMLYALTGSTTGRLSTYLVIDDNGKIYALIGNDYVVDISSGPYKMLVNNGATLETVNYSLNSAQTTEMYYNSNLKDKVFSNLTGLSRYYSLEFVYTATGAGDLDIIIEQLTGSVTSGETYYFEMYTDKINQYIKIGDYYVKVERIIPDVDLEKYNIYYSYNPTISLDTTSTGTSHMFTKTGDYDAFYTYSDEANSDLDDVKVTKYNQMDTIVFNLTESMERKLYPIYTYSVTAKRYIAVETDDGTKFIEYKPEYDVETTISNSIDDEDTNHVKAEKYVNYLYSDYYKNYFSTSVSNVQIAYNADQKTQIDFRYISNFNIDNILSWQPLDIILYLKGYIGPENTSTQIDGYLYNSTVSDDIYLALISETGGKVQNIYIDVTDMVYVEESNATTYLARTTENALLEMILRLFLIGNNTGGFVGESTMIDSVSSFDVGDAPVCDPYAFGTIGGTIFSNYVLSSESAKVTVSASMDITDPKTWNWFDLMYYDTYDKVRTETKYLLYYSSTPYIKFVTKTGNLYLQYEDSAGDATNLLVPFADGGKQTVSYNTDNFNVLSMIYNKLTGSTTGEIQKYTAISKDRTAVNFYYLKNNYDNVYYGVYRLPTGTTTITFTKLTTDGTFSASANEADLRQYRYTLTRGSITNWTLLDFVMNYADGQNRTLEIGAGSLYSYIYKYGDNHYFLVDDYYINLSLLNNNTNSAFDYVDYVIAGGTDVGTITAKNDFSKILKIATSENDICVSYAQLETDYQNKISAVDTTKIDENTTLTYDWFTFSNGFDASDITTWSVADFIMYYAVASGYYIDLDVDTLVGEYVVDIPYTYIEDEQVKVKYIKYKNSINNFQTYVNNGGLPAYVYNMVKTDEFGGVGTYKVINFGNTNLPSQSITFDYDVFVKLYNRKLINTVTASSNSVTLTLGVSEVIETGADVGTGKLFSYSALTSEPAVDFSYDNFYFFNVDEENLEEFGLKEGITQDLVTKIINGKADTLGTINLKLSSGCDINEVSTWTLLDYIVIYEFSRSSLSLNFNAQGANANLLYNMKYNELKNADIYVSLYTNDGSSKFLELNGNLYNLTSYLSLENPETILFTQTLYNAVATYSTGSLFTTIKSAVDSFSASNGSFAKYMQEQLSYYTDSESQRAYNLYMYLTQICYDFIALDSSDEDGTDLAEYMAMKLNALGASSEITEYQLSTYLKNNLSPYLEGLEKGAENILPSSVKINDHDVVSKGTVSDYNFKTLYETVDYSISKAINNFVNIEQDADTISYSLQEGVRYYRTIYYNTKTAYQISLTAFDTYEISKLIKKVSWPEKLMTDMQVLYPDLNWGTLIATDGWIDTLGDYTSAFTNGMYETSGNSANTTAVGLVLSEFLLSLASFDTDGYADYEYTTTFDYDVIKSLMLSMLGEEEFATLSKQAEIFVEMFNTCFAVILDDIAYENGIKVVEGQVDNFVMSVYKSYLATLLLSSDLGEYLYTIATRVYAQYTIYESLAIASGDYAGYYAYVNDEFDENGDLVDAFTFSTFYELVTYENQLAGNSTPTFSFNMLNVYRYYVEKNDSDVMKVYRANAPGGEVNETNIKSSFKNKTSTTYGHQSLYTLLLKKLNQTYTDRYITANGRIDDTSEIYCFMLDTYYSIYQACPKNFAGSTQIPFYLTIFKSYLDGGISRWSTVRDVSTTETNKYLTKYESYQNSLSLKKMMSVMNIVNLWVIEGYDDMEDKEGFSAFLSKINVFDNVATTSPKNVLESSLGPQYQKLIAKIFSEKNMLNWLELFNNSEEGDINSWNFINELAEDLPLIIDELYAIMELTYDQNVDNNTTVNGSVKVFEDVVYESVIEDLDALYMNLSDYISSQEILDQITKYSITFTLAQFGQNYVTSGYEFNIENRNYTFNSYLSASRLAEYVYGGAYLENFGIEPVYTSEDFEGIVSQSKVYDSKEGVMKTSLGMWTQLRSFASELASYTAELYFMTNLKDNAENTRDGIKLTDYIYSTVEGSTNTSITMKTTLEYLILDYLIDNEDISTDTFIRLIFGDSSSDIERMSGSDVVDTIINHANIRNLALYLEGASPTGFDTNLEANKRKAISDYLLLVQSSNYYGYYFGSGNDASERIHLIFKNVISYLITNEEEEETTSENAVNLDNISLKDLKLILMDKIVDYEQNPSETSTENANRYIALFNLITAQFTYREMTFVGATASIENRYSIGTQINPVDIKTDTATGALGYARKSDGTYIYGTFDVDVATKNSILKLAGLENRPIEELVNLEYNSLYDRNGCYDEALGDVFIVCTYDEMLGRYYPVLARGNNTSLSAYADDSNYKKYLDAYGIDIQTSYYDNDEKFVTENHNSINEATAYPIIAKGILDASLHPTAIRIQDGELSYYRTDITASASVGDDAVAATSAVSEVTTVNYVDFVESSSHKNVSSQEKSTMFVGSYDLKNYLNTDTDVYFMQDNISYVIPASDEYGGVNVLDQFSSFYKLGVQTYILLLLGISTMLPLLFNATAAVLRRVIDLIFLTIIGPFVIAMRSFDSEEGKGVGTKAFNQWKDFVQKTLLAGFGYIIGFNIYYLLTQSVMQMTFVSDLTYLSISKIGGLGFVSKALLESVFKYVYLVAAASLVKSGAIMLSYIITAGSVRNPFAPAIGKGTEVMDQIRGTLKDAKSTLNKAKDIYSGQALLEAKDAAVEMGKSLVPGSAIAGSMKETVNEVGDYAKQKALSAMAQSKGVSKQDADKLSKEIIDAQRAERNQKRDLRVQRANNFMKKFGSEMEAKNNMFSSDKAFITREKLQEKEDKLNGKIEHHSEKKAKREGKARDKQMKELGLSEDEMQNLESQGVAPERKKGKLRQMADNVGDTVSAVANKASESVERKGMEMMARTSGMSKQDSKQFAQDFNKNGDSTKSSPSESKKK